MYHRNVSSYVFRNVYHDLFGSIRGILNWKSVYYKSNLYHNIIFNHVFLISDI